MKRYICIILVSVIFFSSCSVSNDAGRRRSGSRSRSDDSLETIKGETDTDETSDTSDTEPSQTETRRPSPTVEATEPSETGSADVFSFSVEPLTWESAVLGQAGVPEGYTLTVDVHNCDETTCIGYPLRVLAMAGNTEKASFMTYYAGEYFLERVVSDGYHTQQDGELDPQTAIFMNRYKNAADFCDSVSQLAFGDVTFVRDEDTSYFNEVSDYASQQFYSTLAPYMGGNGMSLDWFEVTCANRLYSMNDDEGNEYAVNVMAYVEGFQYSISGYGFSSTNILWEVPESYVLVCLMSDYEDIRATDFTIFTENTRVNDEFKALNESLSDEIAQSVINSMNMTVAASTAYAQAMQAMTFASVESSLSYGSYSSDSFSDYIFDQNDYTLSDGSSVQISTSYDYVYQGDNGMVYYSDSAFAPSGGMTQLYPN